MAENKRDSSSLFDIANSAGRPEWVAYTGHLGSVPMKTGFLSEDSWWWGAGCDNKGTWIKQGYGVRTEKEARKQAEQAAKGLLLRSAGYSGEESQSTKASAELAILVAIIACAARIQTDAASTHPAGDCNQYAMAASNLAQCLERLVNA